MIGTVTATARPDTVLCVAARRRLIPMLVLVSASPLLAAAVVRAAAPPPPLELSLEQALQLGLERSLALAGQAVLVRQGEALVGLAQTRFLPKLDLLAVGSYVQVGTSASQVSNLPLIGNLNLNLGANGYAVAQNTFGDLGLSLTFPLIDFGRGPQRQAAQADLAAARADRREQQRGSRFAITAAVHRLFQLPRLQRLARPLRWSLIGLATASLLVGSLLPLSLSGVTTTMVWMGSEVLGQVVPRLAAGIFWCSGYFAIELAAGLSASEIQLAQAAAEAAEQEARAMQLEATAFEHEVHRLQAQMNPHFLFNALNAIVACKDSPEDVARVTRSRPSPWRRWTTW